MRFAFCVPVRGYIHETKGVWGLLYSELRFYFDGKAKVYVADALEDTETEVFLKKLFEDKLKYLRVKDKCFIEQANALLGEVEEEIVCFSHNDVYFYEDPLKWVKLAFKDEEVGFAAAFGVCGTMWGGTRLESCSNMLEAELHGKRVLEMGYITHGDGFFLSFRKEALEKVGGFDERYKRFHYYDRDICLSILDKGYKGVYLPIFCHHRGGITSCQPEYQEWVNNLRGVEKGGDLLDHQENMLIFNHKWEKKLPVMVDFKTGEFYEGTQFSFKKWR